MKKLLITCLGSFCLVALSSCGSPDYDDDDDDDGHVHVRQRTTVTEEVTRSNPYTGAVQTQTTQTVY